MAQARGLDRRPTFLAATVLVCLVCALFSPIIGYDFMGYDTPAQVVENPYIRGFTAENLKTIFTSTFGPGVSRKKRARAERPWLVAWGPFSRARRPA